MDDAHPVGVLDGVGSFGHPAQRCRDGRAGLAGEVAALDEVHHQEVPAVG